MIKDQLHDVLLSVHDGEITVSSNFAREHAAVIAMAASKGLISTKIHMNVFGRVWKLTVGGLTVLNSMEIEG